MASQGYVYQQGLVTVNSHQSTCYEQVRKQATLSPNVIAINQCLLRHNDMHLLQGAVCNTADLMFLVRYARPDLFMEDHHFTQLAALAQNLPFGLDMKALDGNLIAGFGTYLSAEEDQNDREGFNKLERPEPP